MIAIETSNATVVRCALETDSDGSLGIPKKRFCLVQTCMRSR
jgi:hypothetical protein